MKAKVLAGGERFNARVGKNRDSLVSLHHYSENRFKENDNELDSEVQNRKILVS